MQRRTGIVLSLGILAAISVLAFGKFAHDSKDSEIGDSTSVMSGQSKALDASPLAYFSGVNVGTRYRYRAQFESGYKMNESGFDLTGQADLVWTVVAQTPASWRLRGELQGLRMSTADGTSPFASLDAIAVAQAGARPFYIDVQQDGRIAGIYAESSSPVWLNSIRRSLAAAFQVSDGSSQAAWETQERDVTGEVVVQYARTDADRLTKTKKRYARVRKDKELVDANGIAEVTGSAQLVLQQERAIRDYSGRESLTLHVFESPIVAQAKLTLSLTQSDRVAAEPVDLRGYVFLPLFGAPQPQQLQAATTVGRDLKTLLEVLRALPATANVPWDVIDEIAALFVRDPAAIREAVALLSSSEVSESLQKNLLTALAQAKTEEAQNALLDVAIGSERPSIRDTAMVHITLLQTPAVSTIQRLGQLAEGDFSSATTQGAALAYGAAAKHGASSDDTRVQVEAVAAGARLVDAYKRSNSAGERRLLMRALGNSGAPGALEPLRAVAMSEQPRDRAAAVGALRFVEAPEADAILQNAFLKDQSEAVRREALASLDYRQFTPELEQTLEQGLNQETSPELRKDVLALLAKNGSARGEDLVRRSAQTDPSESVRTFAEKLLPPRSATSK